MRWVGTSLLSITGPPSAPRARVSAASYCPAAVSRARLPGARSIDDEHLLELTRRRRRERLSRVKPIPGQHRSGLANLPLLESRSFGTWVTILQVLGGK